MFVVKFLSKPIDPAVSGNYSHRCRIVNGVLTSVSEVDRRSGSSCGHSDTSDQEGSAGSTSADQSTTEVGGSFKTSVNVSSVCALDAAVVRSELTNTMMPLDLHRKSIPISLNCHHSSLTSPGCSVVPDEQPAKLNTEVDITVTSPPYDGCNVAVTVNEAPTRKSVNAVGDNMTSCRDIDVNKSVATKAALRLSRDKRLKANRRERERVHSLAVAFNVLGDLLPQSCAR